MPKRRNIESFCQVDLYERKIVNTFDNFKKLRDTLGTTATKSLKECIGRCLDNKANTANKYGWIYKKDLDEKTLDKYVDEIIEPENFLINKYPNVALEWHYEKNVGIDIKFITYGSELYVWWKCAQGHEWQASISHRCIHSTNCPTCYKISIGADPEERENYIRTYQQTKNAIEIGDDTEDYIVDLLENDGYQVERYGASGDKSDIVVTLNQNVTTFTGQIENKTFYKSLQVKTLTLTDEHRQSYITQVKEYKDDMLICMVNKERTKFALEFYKNIKHLQNLHITFLNPSKSKYKDIIYSTEEDFLKN